MATNHITILGRLTKDPDVKYVASGKAVATFTIYMQGIHNHEINADEICETLKQEGIKFLYETDL